VQSKGHCVEALYVVLADRGYFPAKNLETVCRYKSHYVGHPTRHVPGIEMNTGALGHGLPICIGMALAAKMDGAPYRVFTLLGDGELAEGSNWEAGLAAAHYDLDNLVAILDHNTLQITGPTRDVMSTEPVADKWRSFGWNVRVVNGHDYAQLTRAMTDPPAPGRPTFIVANTVKGKGISFMENVAKWHHGVPNESELRQALCELDAAEARLKERVK
jgi:transketolase